MKHSEQCAAATSETYRMRLDREILRKASMRAKAEQRTLASLIRFLLVKYLEEQ